MTLPDSVPARGRYLSTKAVDKSVEKGAASEGSQAALQFAQNLTRKK